jgi:hypothetical protein
MHRWIQGLFIIAVGSLSSPRDAWAQSDPAPKAMATATDKAPVAPLAPLAEPDRRVPMQADDSGVVLYRVFDGRTSPLPRHGVVKVDGIFAEPICELPCAPTWNSLQGDEFFFGGKGVSSSQHFRMGLPQQTRAFRVSKGNRDTFLDGVGLIVISVVPIGVGLAAIPVSLMMDGSLALPDPVADNPRTINYSVEVARREQYRKELLICGIGSLVLGGIGLGIGIPLYRAGQTTYVSFDPHALAFRF